MENALYKYLFFIIIIIIIIIIVIIIIIIITGPVQHVLQLCV